MLAFAAVLFALVVDFNSVLRLMGYATAAHACPVTEHLALTARHVVSGDEDQMRSYRFDTHDGVEGSVVPVWRADDADLALVYTEASLRYYPIATQAPQPGDLLSLMGYDWRKADDAYAERVWESVFLRQRAGTLIFKKPGEGGSSGSCVFNAAGEVVGVNIGVKSTQDQRAVGVATSVVGAWMPKLELPAKKE